MAVAAVRLASQLFEDLRDIKVLFVGAGEMIDLAATHFAARQPKSMALPTAPWSAAKSSPRRFGLMSRAWPTCPAACMSLTRDQLHRQHCPSSAWCGSAR
jgi:hypothetical protein